jgi:hypothetical protein
MGYKITSDDEETMKLSQLLISISKKVKNLRF